MFACSSHSLMKWKSIIKNRLEITAKVGHAILTNPGFSFYRGIMCQKVVIGDVLIYFILCSNGAYS